jgi:uncharacterized repeat protein (TIGR04052 family)
MDRTTLAHALLALPLALVAACGDDGGDGASATDGHDTHHHDTDGHDTDGGSSGGGTTGDADQSVVLQFRAQVGDEPATCTDTYTEMGAAPSTIAIRDMRLYISGVHLLEAGGGDVELALEQDGTWQYEDVALLDFEDGSGSCAEMTTTETNMTIRGTVPAGDYTGVRFDLGVPFALNHLDVATAEPPLNVDAMYWVWATGHKFAKIDVTADEDVAFNFHLGSGQCDATGPMAPEDSCQRPHVPTIVFQDFDPDADTIIVDLAGLYDGVDLTMDTGGPPGCMANLMNDGVECDQIFANVGLSWTEGGCINDCADQKLFRAE